MENSFNLKKFLAEGTLLKEKSWAEIDRDIALQNQQDEKDQNEYINTASGRNAVKMIKDLISKPYDTDDLRDLLEILNLSKQKFKWAAKSAGMEFNSNAAGIHIYDSNYKNPDVAIDNINGNWYVG